MMNSRRGNTMNKPMPDDLLVAIASGQPVSLHDIMSLDVDINAFGIRVQRTVLMSAAYAGRSGLINALVERGAVLDFGDLYGVTALHEAAGMGHVDAVTTLLDLGANI